MSNTTPRGGSLDAFILAAPRLRRAGLRLLLTLAQRPRGVALLSHMGPLHQLAGGLVAFGRYDEPRSSAALGWDAEAVVARGRALRRAEGRP